MFSNVNRFLMMILLWVLVLNKLNNFSGFFLFFNLMSVGLFILMGFCMMFNFLLFLVEKIFLLDGMLVVVVVMWGMVLNLRISCSESMI